MSVYLYNLGFSLADADDGNFLTGGSGLSNSDAWFVYNQSGLPSGVTDNVVALYGPDRQPVDFIHGRPQLHGGLGLPACADFQYRQSSRTGADSKAPAYSGLWTRH